MATLYHCIGARSFRPLWMMEELNMDYRLKILPFPPRVEAPDYLQENPLGTVPLFVDDTVRMTESVAICQYLCATHGSSTLQVTPQEDDFGTYLNFLHFGEATLTFPQTLVLRYNQFEPPERRQPTVANDYARWFVARLRTLETQLTTRDYICANRFTTADVSVGYALLLADALMLSERFKPAVAAYWERLQQRQAFQRAIEKEKQAALTQGVSTTASFNAGT